MVTDEQLKKANAIAKTAFEATKRIYDLAIVASEKISADVGEQLNLKVADYRWGSQSGSYINQYGRLTKAEILVLRRYFYTSFGKTKTRELKPKTLPFILFSIATRKLDPPQLIYGILANVDWAEGQPVEIEPFMYEISERREQKPLEVRGVKSMSSKGRADVEFKSIPLVAISEDTINDIVTEIVAWFEERLL
jgi:hypothetical protein